MLPVRFGGPYHIEFLDLELLCRMNSPRHPEEVVGAVLSFEGYHKFFKT